MTYCSNTLIFAFCIVYAYAHLGSAHADTWGDKTYTRGAYIHMVTTNVSQYFARKGRGNGHGYIGTFVFGNKYRGINEEECAALDGALHCYVKRRKMKDGEYRNFTDMSLFFEKKQRLLYKVAIELEMPRESHASDRMKIVSGILEDCKVGFGLLPVRTDSNDGRVVYLGSDDEFEISLELSKGTCASRRLLLAITNTKVRDGRTSGSDDVKSAFSPDNDVEVEI